MGATSHPAKNDNDLKWKWKNPPLKELTFDHLPKLWAIYAGDTFLKGLINDWQSTL